MLCLPPYIYLSVHFSVLCTHTGPSYLAVVLHHRLPAAAQVFSFQAAADHPSMTPAAIATPAPSRGHQSHKIRAGGQRGGQHHAAKITQEATGQCDVFPRGLHNDRDTYMYLRRRHCYDH